MTRFLCALSLCLGCADPEEAMLVPEPPMVDEEPGALPERTLEHTGQPAEVGGHDVEVLVHSSGHVYVYPQDTDIAQASLVVEVPLASGQKRRVPLRWNEEEVRFEGRMRRAQPAAGPVVVVLEEGGQRHTVDVAVVLAPAIDVTIETPSPRVDVRVEAPRPSTVVEVRAPTPRVEIHAPAPRVQIRGKHKHRKHRHRGRVRVRGGMHHGRVDVRIR